MTTPSSALTPDICVIGAGSGGLSVAAAAAAFGASVVLIEKGRMGGDCLNFGCVPSKSLLAAAHAAQVMREAGRFGIAAAEPAIDWGQVHGHVQGVIGAIAPNDSVERFTKLGVQVIQAPARFTGPDAVEAGGRKIRARRFVVAAGSSPLVPPIPGLDQVPFLTNETIFERKEAVAHLLVIGAGPVGIELAQAHRRLGAAVTVAASGRALSREDSELAAVVLARLRAEGVVIHENAKVLRAEPGENTAAIRLRVETADGAQALEGSHLLVAAGRKANVEGLGLDAAGIAFDAEGIRVSPALRTTNRRVYAVGDIVSGAPRFTHVANYHAGLAIRAILFRLPVREKRKILPRVTYTDPELAQAGITEAEAVSAGVKHSIVRWPLAENDRAQAERETAGLIKLVVGRRGKILGAGIAGAQAGELIHIWALALAKDLKLSDMASYVAPYPTRGEIGKRAALAYLSPAARNPLVRGLIRLLRLLG